MLNSTIRVSSGMAAIAGAFTGALSLCACAAEYSARAIEGRVVDAATGAPLEGVNVVVAWELEYIRPGISEGRGVAMFELAETVTAANGEFRFAA